MEVQPSMGDQFLACVKRIIEENLDNEDFSVEDLAQQAGISRSMLHRKLMKLTGKSASDLIMEKRLTQAKELLENNVATASEIAYKVGFNTPSYFNKVFKGYYHVSPGDVRKGIAAIPPQTPGKPQKNRDAARKNIIRMSLIFLIGILTLAVIGTGLYMLLRKDNKAVKSIAILPFDNLGSDKNNQYFADGVVEDLLSRLSHIGELKVISRTSSEMFRDKGNKSVPQIAKILNVNYILEGTVQREMDRIRITVKLIDARNDKPVWSNLYERDLNQFFALQSDIASRIASELSLLLSDQQLNVLKQNKTKNLKAFEYYQLGLIHSNKYTNEDLYKGNEYYKKAIEEDPNYALAYAGLAAFYYFDPAWDEVMEWTEEKDKGIQLAMKALELDPNLAEAHTALGNLYMGEWNWEKAEKEFMLAIKLNPNYSLAHMFYAELLMFTNKPEIAREHLNKALELDPLSYRIRHRSCEFFYHCGQFKEALSENRICLELVKDHSRAVSLEFLIFYQLGMEQEALESAKHYGMLEKLWNPAAVDSAYASKGLDGLIWLRIKKRPAGESTKAIWYAMVGEYDTAMDLLEKAYSNGHLPTNVSYRIEFKELHNNPRFIALCKKMGLQPYYPWIK